MNYLASNYKHVSDSDGAAVSCDLCRIVDVLLQLNLTLSFVGDSMTKQVGVGFECDLLRRGYAVTTRILPWIKNKKNCGWRYCIGQKTEMLIQEPSFEDNDDDQRKTAHIYHYGMYRPNDRDDNAEVKQHIMATSDVVVFDFGLHWTPLEASDFGRAMTSFLRGFAAPDNNLTLLAWRETSAQHFDADGGHFGNERRGDTCTAIQTNMAPKGANTGFRLPLMKQATFDAGLTWTSPLDPNFSSSVVNEPELVVLPFRDYTVPLHYLHPGECTHYCHSPHMWLPIWRALRLAIDRAVRIKQQHPKSTTSS
jgi:hypothetical protein